MFKLLFFRKFHFFFPGFLFFLVSFCFLFFCILLGLGRCLQSLSTLTRLTTNTNTSSSLPFFQTRPLFHFLSDVDKKPRRYGPLLSLALPKAGAFWPWTRECLRETTESKREESIQIRFIINVSKEGMDVDASLTCTQSTTTSVLGLHYL